MRDQGTKSFVEYPIALAELRRLDAVPKQPDQWPESPSQQAPHPGLAATADQKPTTTLLQPIRRVLTEASGNRQVTVDIVGFDGKMLRVRTMQGEQKSIEINKLSSTDRDWINTNVPQQAHAVNQ